MAGRREVALAMAVGLLASCGGGGAKSDGAAGAGGASSSGAAGAAGGSGGTTGIAGTTGGLPACAISTRPSDPVNPDGGIASNCNTLTFGADWVASEMAIADGGIVADAGAMEQPSGGMMLDGDYDLVRFRTGNNMSRTRRSLRFFEGGTFMEWLVGSETPNGDGGVTTGQVSINTRQQPSAPDPFSVTFTCGNPELIGPDFTFSYTATGDELELFTYYTGRLVTVYTYRRACAR